MEATKTLLVWEIALSSWRCVSILKHSNYFFRKFFGWHLNDIATECEEHLGPAGYCALQLLPVNELKKQTHPDAFRLFKSSSMRFVLSISLLPGTWTFCPLSLLGTALAISGAAAKTWRTWCSGATRLASPSSRTSSSTTSQDMAASPALVTQSINQVHV